MNAINTRNRLKRSSPEAQGIASAAILAFVEAVDRDIDSLHSLMLLRRGKVVAEGWWAPYAPERPHVLYSLSKSFTSSAVGLAVAEGLLTVDDRVLSFFPDEAPAEVSDNLAALRVRDLLTMTVGHAEDTVDHLRESNDDNWARAFLARDVVYPPGTHFLYNSGATYMLSAIVQKLTGQTVLEYLTPRLFEPLNIHGATWETCPRGINTGGWGLSLKTEDIARFGQMYLQKGTWHKKRILPEAWIAEATAYHSDNSANENPDWAQGYGYQFWRCRHNAYRGDGAFGQYCLVMPEQDAVLAMTGGLDDMQAVLDLVWERLLPAMQPAELPDDAAAEQRLRDALADLALTPQTGQAASPIEAELSGRRYVFEANEPGLEFISFNFDDDGCAYTVRDATGEHRIRAGRGAWATDAVDAATGDPVPVAASFAWITDDALALKLCFYETPYCPTITCRFAGESVQFEFQANVSFGPKESPPLTGRLG
jgi:CubicO group peptidase (beta-lactamase class C family)